MPSQHTTQTKNSEHDRPSQASATAKSPAAQAMHPMLHLQQQVGNQAVGRLIQAKLTVGEPNDVYEQEADRVAAEVVSQIHAPKNSSTDQTASVQRQVIGSEEEELQTKPLIQCKSDMGGMAVSSEIESSIQQARGFGQPLAESIRTPMEQAFGADFSRVRVHIGAESDRLNRAVQARAFTTGQDIFFRQGEYSPGSRGGQVLIAHELTHVVQQKGFSAVPNNLSLKRFIQRKINWDPTSKLLYQQSFDGLFTDLKGEFSWVKPDTITELIMGIEKKQGKPWTPFQAYQGIKNYIRNNYPMPPIKVDMGSTNITKDEAQWYFISNFKTCIEAIIDGKWSLKFFNTPDENHAEDNLIAHLDKFIEEKRWDEDFSESHTLLIRINNSPCRRCADKIYKWKNRDIFVALDIQFSNMYEKDTGFTNATTTLKKGGITMSLFSVINNLLPLISKEEYLKFKELENRKIKDQQEAIDWNKWQEQNQEKQEEMET
jgi:Domain of unknown function (DUF4157)/Secreted Novel AID/APOBEC-like Deaminase 4